MAIDVSIGTDSGAIRMYKYQDDEASDNRTETTRLHDSGNCIPCPQAGRKTP